ncbi:MAG: hypothetical protein JSR78_07560 [Proteobacteria bacterium]|nr:hypothetical protein [Pseudomonadota bacterium]
MNRSSRRAFEAAARKFMSSDRDCSDVVDAAATTLRSIPGFADVAFVERRAIIVDLRARNVGTFAPVEGQPNGCQLVDVFGLPLPDVAFHQTLQRIRAAR